MTGGSGAARAGRPGRTCGRRGAEQVPGNGSGNDVASGFFDSPLWAETRRWRVSGTPFTLIESVFATVRFRTVRTRGALSQKTAKLMGFTLVSAASKTWRTLNGTHRLPVRAMALTIEGVKFTDSVAHRDPAESRAA